MKLRTQCIILCTLLIIALGGCRSVDPDVEETKDYLVAVIMSSGDDKFEVRKYNNETELKIYKNGEYQSSTGKNHAVKELLKLDIPEEVSDSDKVELADLGLLADNTYEIELEDASNYVGQLLSDGYTQVCRVDTYKFIEMYLQDSDGMFMRLIITPSYMVAYETNSIGAININDYIFE